MVEIKARIAGRRKKRGTHRLRLPGSHDWVALRWRGVLSRKSKKLVVTLHDLDQDFKVVDPHRLVLKRLEELSRTAPIEVVKQSEILNFLRKFPTRTPREIIATWGAEASRAPIDLYIQPGVEEDNPWVRLVREFVDAHTPLTGDLWEVLTRSQQINEVQKFQAAKRWGVGNVSPIGTEKLIGRVHRNPETKELIRFVVKSELLAPLPLQGVDPRSFVKDYLLPATLISIVEDRQNPQKFKGKTGPPDLYPAPIFAKWLAVEVERRCAFLADAERLYAYPLKKCRLCRAACDDKGVCNRCGSENTILGTDALDYVEDSTLAFEDPEQRLHLEAALSSAAGSPEDIIALDEIKKRAREVGSLSEIYTLELYLEGHTPVEMSGLTERSESTHRTELARLIKKIQKRIQRPL